MAGEPIGGRRELLLDGVGLIGKHRDGGILCRLDGFDSGGRRRVLEKAYFVEPLEINGKRLRAIQTTTAGPLCQSAMMLLGGQLKGVVLQSQIPPAEFMSGTFVANIYK